jgi:hypothetical protein
LKTVRKLGSSVRAINVDVSAGTAGVVAKVVEGALTAPSFAELSGAFSEPTAATASVDAGVEGADGGVVTASGFARAVATSALEFGVMVATAGASAPAGAFAELVATSDVAPAAMASVDAVALVIGEVVVVASGFAIAVAISVPELSVVTAAAETGGAGASLLGPGGTAA